MNIILSPPCLVCKQILHSYIFIQFQAQTRFIRELDITILYYLSVIYYQGFPAAVTITGILFIIIDGLLKVASKISNIAE